MDTPNGTSTDKRTTCKNDRYEVLGSFFFRLYGALWRLALPFLRRKARLKDGFEERLVPENWLPAPQTESHVPFVDIWLQAASGGEAHLVTEILDAWVASPPAFCMPEGKPLRVLITTWTRQGHGILTSAISQRPAWAACFSIFVRYAPFDHPSIARRAVRVARPRFLALLETELWPGLLGACTEAGVPVLVLNARMTKTSLELYKIIARPLRACAPHHVEAVTREDAGRFCSLFPSLAAEHCRVMPHIKYDRAARSLTAPSAPLPPPFTAEFFAGRAPVLLFASVRKEEEKYITPALMQLQRTLPPQALCVVAPRHLARVPAWEKRLHDLGIMATRASACRSITPPRPEPPRSIFDAFFAPLAPPPPFRVLIWDIFGHLPVLYSMASLVFVGGSLAPLGGQNFLESLSAGRIPLVGPFTETFSWALTAEPAPSLHDLNLVHLCPKPARFMACLRHGLASMPSAPSPETVKERFAAFLAPRTGGSAHAATVLKEYCRED